jgi:hypothetical protein
MPSVARSLKSNGPAAGGRHGAAVQRHQVEFRAEAADGDLRTFVIDAADRDAGDALQRLRKVLIRELADVFGRDRIDDRPKDSRLRSMEVT